VKPIYLTISDKEFKDRIEIGYEIMRECRLCGRNCKVNRLIGELGICRSKVKPWVSSYNLHFGEEPPISGTMGSGTIFLTQCSLRCVFCQNYPISQLGVGNETTEDGLSNMMTELQNMGAHNINLVTPTHFVPPIIKALYIARKKGLKIPIVYNTGGYDSIETVKLLNNIVDIYMPDAKYGDSKTASKYSAASNYVNVMKLAIKEMHSQVGALIIEDGIAKRGLIIRHLVLPNNLYSTYKVLEFINKELPRNTYISLMAQYFPAHRANEFKEISRELTAEEYEMAVKFMNKLGLKRGWIQQIE